MHRQQSLNGIGPDWLYEDDFQNTVRYVLGVKGERPLFCLGINPSTAIPNDLDNTLKSVSRLARNNGYAGWVMLNVYPQRATDPSDLHPEPNLLIHQRNLQKIDDLLASNPHPVLWAAWGTLITKRPYLRRCLSDIQSTAARHDATWVAIGKRSADGHPHHPLYLSSKEKTAKFQIGPYMEALLGQPAQATPKGDG